MEPIEVLIVNMHDAKTRLSQLVSDHVLARHEEVILANRGTPVAKLVPLEPIANSGARPKRTRLGFMAGQLTLPATMTTFDAIGRDEIEQMFDGDEGSDRP